MRSALICVFIIFTVHKCRALNYEDFKPTPIPLGEWIPDTKEDNAGTLQEVIPTNATTVAAIPPHYWEDALKHSVYLTLVRDKIDQLIAKGSVISPNSKPEQHNPKEFDDHNLWDKIKNAPFDRLKPDEGAPLGDITIVSKGRLLEANDEYRFIEDETSKKCNDDSCTDGVKAFWSVKRARQRDAETIPGKYHYELTFSVTSHLQKKQRKPYDSPVRTFTVRESNSTDEQPIRVPEPPPPPKREMRVRPQRAVWVHRNIHPEGQADHYQNRKAYHGFGLDKLLTSLFSDDEPKEHTTKYKIPHSSHSYSYSTHPKNGYGTSPGENYIKKQPHTHKPQFTKYTRPQFASQYTQPLPPLGSSFPPIPPPVHPITPPTVPIGPPTLNPSQPPLTAPPMHHQTHNYRYPEEPISYKPHHNDNKHQPSNQIKTTKPVPLMPPTSQLPTSPITFANLNLTMELPTKWNFSDITTREPEIITYNMFTKPKPTSTKLNYIQDHIRPPVFNAPPGVFGNTEKKPFKPMPPLKHKHYMRPHKTRPPVDFRPSPQVLDVQYSDPDPLSDAFRPMSINYGDSNTTEVSGLPAKIKNNSKLKPLKKHEGVKPQRSSTTIAPEIITAHDLSMEQISLDTMQWANNILGAFSKTPPTASKTHEVDVTEPETTTVVSTTTDILTSTATVVEQPMTTTIPIPAKRTRPPPKFGKPKVKKVRRNMTTTTSTTTTTRSPPTTILLKDLTPAATAGNTKPTWQPKEKPTETQTSTTQLPTSTTETTTATVTTVSTTPRPTPSVRFTTTVPTTTETNKRTSSTKIRNRFRESTLMIKGTSLKHDKWNSPLTSTDKSKTVIPLSSKSGRRKASNFQGYVSSTPTVVDERQREDHADVLSDTNQNEDNNVEQTSTQNLITALESMTNDTLTLDNAFNEFQDDGLDIINDGLEELKDKTEYMFNVRKETTKNDSPDQQTVTVTDNEVTMAATKNKTKCKKRKNTTTVAEDTTIESTVSDVAITTYDPTDITTIDSIEIDVKNKSNSKNKVADNFSQTDPITDASNKQEILSDFDYDVQKFLESIKDTRNEPFEHYDDVENVDYTFDRHKDRRGHADSYEDFHEHQFSFLDLMTAD